MLGHVDDIRSQSVENGLSYRRRGNLYGAKKMKCKICNGFHPPEEPHNWTTRFYQLRFREDHGREPTLADAFGHCSEATRRTWLFAFSERGIEWTTPTDADIVVELPQY